LDDNDHYQESEYDYTAYTNNDDIIRQFNPGEFISLFYTRILLAADDWK